MGFSLSDLKGRFRSSPRFRLGVIGFCLSLLLYLVAWLACRQLEGEILLYQGEFGAFGEIKLGTTALLWWFRGVLLSIWSISVSVYLLFIHPESAYQQAKATFRRFREEQQHTYRNAFLRSLATSAPFRSVFRQGFLLSVLVINGFSRVSTVDFAFGFAAWLILVFLLLLLLRFDPSPTYEEFQTDWDSLVEQFWKNTKKGGGLYAITTVVTVTLIQGVKIYLNSQNLAFERDKLSFRKDQEENKVKFKEMDVQISENNRQAAEDYRRGKELEAKSRWWSW